MPVIIFKFDAERTLLCYTWFLRVSIECYLDKFITMVIDLNLNMVTLIIKNNVRECLASDGNNGGRLLPKQDQSG